MGINIRVELGTEYGIIFQKLGEFEASIMITFGKCILCRALIFFAYINNYVFLTKIVL